VVTVRETREIIARTVFAIGSIIELHFGNADGLRLALVGVLTLISAAILFGSKNSEIIMETVWYPYPISSMSGNVLMSYSFAAVLVVLISSPLSPSSLPGIGLLFISTYPIE
jgi:hypothetical protein